MSISKYLPHIKDDRRILHPTKKDKPIIMKPYDNQATFKVKCHPSLPSTLDFLDLLIGAVRSGKTSWALKLLQEYQNDYDVIYIVMPQGSKDEKVANFRLEKTRVVVFDDIPNIAGFLRSIEEKANKDHRCLILFDDLTTYASLFKQGGPIFNFIICRRRFFCGIIMIAHGYKRVPKCVRENADIITLFNVLPVKALQDILEETTLGEKIDTIVKIIRDVFKKNLENKTYNNITINKINNTISENFCVIDIEKFQKKIVANNISYNKQ
jgi:hypothetical protein